ncbi:recombinase family protein [Selenomonas sputigena]|uniref:recombinase family protein n=1 Tax=Selenomonas sputigena TaxID=69823 RepID=UPI00222FD8A9|nr:recombinase family protein [Selenomonas sputigena]UZD42522.1 recombinase family protein [Selenomonas sputigena]
MSNIYGYIRVSTITQRDDRQWLAMETFGIPKECIFVDKQSGKDFDRPAYREMIATVKPGDTVVVKSLDRLGRNYDEMIRQLDIITKKKEAAIVVIDLPLLDTRNKYGDELTAKLISNLVIQMFSYVAETERNMNHQRTMEGLAAARARGVKFGRKPIEKPDSYETFREQWKNKKISARKAAVALGVSTPTFLKWVKESVNE